MKRGINTERKGNKKRPKILFVNDEPFFSNAITELLTRFGKLDVTYAMTVEEALSVAERDAFGVVLADVMMPSGPFDPVQTDSGVATGLVLIPELRERLPDAKFIVMTNVPNREIVDHLKGEEGVVYVGTPPHWKELITLIRRTLGLEEFSPSVFIVHGHDSATIYELKDYIRTSLGFDDVSVLREIASHGKTMIEKFEEYGAQADLIFVVLTPDDFVVDQKMRNGTVGQARQNVIFEMGYFCGARGRQSGRMIILKKGELEVPSDLAGIGYIDITDRPVKDAGEEIRGELGEWPSLTSGTR